MFEWLINNIGSILIIILLAAVIAAVIFKMVSDKKSGKSGCGCGCEHCAMKGECHRK